MDIVSGWVGTTSEGISGLTAASNTIGGSYSQGLRGLYQVQLMYKNFIAIIHCLITTWLHCCNMLCKALPSTIQKMQLLQDALVHKLIGNHCLVLLSCVMFCPGCQFQVKFKVLDFTYKTLHHLGSKMNVCPNQNNLNLLGQGRNQCPTFEK